MTRQDLNYGNLPIIALEIPASHRALLGSLETSHPEAVRLAEIKHFDGLSYAVHLVIALSAVTIPAVAKVIVELIRAKQHVSVKFEGVEVKGISENNALEVLQRLRLPSSSDTDPE